MSSLTPKTNRTVVHGFIDETPACTPIPQATSTGTHGNSDSPLQVKCPDPETVKPDLCLESVIGGLEGISNKFKDIKLKFHEEKNSATNIGFQCKSTNISTSICAESEADSSLGILKLDELQGLSENDVSSDGQKLLFDEMMAENNYYKDAASELSDLAVDMRLRLQKELAKRALDKFSLACSSDISDITCSETGNKNDFELRSSYPKASTVIVDNSPRHSMENIMDISSKNPADISDYEIENRLDNMSNCTFNNSEITQDASSCLESFRNPFDNSRLDNEAVAIMAAMMVEFSEENFIPGEKCGEKFSADESIWKKENIPPAILNASAPVTNLDFSGILGNSKISLPAESFRKEQQKRKVSVGEFFRLKSNVNASFGMPSESPQKRILSRSPRKSQTLPQAKETNKNLSRRTTDSKPVSVHNSTGYLSDSINSSVCSQGSSANDSLSLSCIANIIASVDTCASPRTVVSNILKKGNLYSSRGMSKHSKENRSVPYTSLVNSSTHTNKSSSKVRNDHFVNSKSQTDLSNYSNSTDKNWKMEFSSNTSSNSKEPLISLDSSFKHSEHTSNSSSLSNAVEDLNLDKKVDEVGNEDWMLPMQSVNEGVGARLHSSMLSHNPDESKVVNNSMRMCEQLPRIENSIAAEDMSILKCDNLKEKRDESILNMTRELANLRRDSVDCSSFVHTLKKKCPEILSEVSLSMKDDDPSCGNTDCDSSFQWFGLDSNESKIPLPPEREASSFQVLTDTKWVRVNMSTSSPYICVGIPLEMTLLIQSVTHHWLYCGLELVKVELPGTGADDQIALVQPPSKKVLMDPNSLKEAKVKIVPLCEGKIQITLKINLWDAVTREEQSTISVLQIIGEEPQILITGTGDSSTLDFGTLPEECAKEMGIKLTNSGSAVVPLRLATLHEKNKLCTFVLVDPTREENEKPVENEVVKELAFSLDSGETKNFQIMFAAPPMKLLTDDKGFVQFSGMLSVELDGIVPVELESFNLIGCVGSTKLGVFRPAIPIKMIASESKKTDVHLLPLKNNGLVSVTLSLTMQPLNLKEAMFTVEPSKIVLQPGEQTSVKISFSAKCALSKIAMSVLQIEMEPLGPKFYLEVTGEYSTQILDKEIKAKQEKMTKNIKKDGTAKKRNESASLLNKTSSTSSSENASQKSVRSPGALSSLSSGSRDDKSSKLQNSRSSSSRSSVSEKLNIRTTHQELIWGSIPVGKSDTKTFDIRSFEFSNMTAEIQIYDRHHNFKLIDERGNTATEMNVTLLAQKSQTFSVVFTPKQIGAARAKIVFVIRDMRLVIPLYGFGGHSRLIAKGVPRDGAGRMWLMLYQHTQKKEWETSFHLRNLGDLRAFIKIKPILKGFQNDTSLGIIVQPSQLVINEGGSVEIQVKYKPQHKDIQFLMSKTVEDVIEIASLSLVSGDEPTRQRLRRIHNKNLDNTQGLNGCNVVSKSSPPPLELGPLCEYFTGEGEGGPDVTALADRQDCAVVLYSGINHQEIILLLENVVDGQGVDASRAFQSMYQCVDLSCTRFDDAESPSKSDLVWEITPSTVSLQPPVISSVSVLLWTRSANKHTFEAVVTENPPGFTLLVNPNAGFIPSSDGINLTICCIPEEVSSSNFPNTWNGSIKIYTENECKDLCVCVQYTHYHTKDVQKVKAILEKSSKQQTQPSISTPATKFLSPNAPFQRKKMNSGSIKSIPNFSGEGVSSPRSCKKMLTLGACSSLQSNFNDHGQQLNKMLQIKSTIPVSGESFGQQRLGNTKLLSPYKPTTFVKPRKQYSSSSSTNSSNGK